MISYRYEFNKDDMEKLKKAMKESIGKEKYIQVVDKTTLTLFGDIVKKTLSKTGKTRRGWVWQRVGDFVRVIFNKSPVAVYLEDGTKPHDIYAKPGKTLAWQSNKGNQFAVEKVRTISKLTGKALKNPKREYFVFRQHVHHPGTKAVDMVKSSIPNALAYWNELVKKMLGEIWTK